MDTNIKQYADTIFGYSKEESTRANQKSLQEFAHQRAIRNSAASLLSGPDIQSVVKIYGTFIEQCTTSRLKSYQQAYDEGGAIPSEQDFKDILAECNAVRDNEIPKCVTAIRHFIAYNGRGIAGGYIPDEPALDNASVTGHARMLGEWKLWKAKVQLKSTSGQVQKQLVFISCGQFSEHEVQLGKQLAAEVNRFSSFEGYFAEDQNSLSGLSTHIFRALERCAAFVAVMHHRGQVTALQDTHIRASIWIEQEIAIAAFLTTTRNLEIPVLLYIQKGIKREGVREQLKLSPIEFTDDSEVLADFVNRLKSGAFSGLGHSPTPKRV